MAKSEKRGTRKQGRPVRDRAERREDALRPCRFLGYDRDALAVYLMSREAYEIAEVQLRRAIWLNPFEPRFKAHLAWCLHTQGRHVEAVESLVSKTQDRRPEIEQALAMLGSIERELGDATGLSNPDW